MKRITILLSILIFQVTSSKSFAQSWTEWVRLSNNVGVEASVSFKIMGNCQNMSYSFFRTNNATYSPTGYLIFSYAFYNCDGVLTSYSSTILLAKTGIDQNDGNWFLTRGGTIQNIRIEEIYLPERKLWLKRGENGGTIDIWKQKCGNSDKIESGGANSNTSNINSSGGNDEIANSNTSNINSSGGNDETANSLENLISQLPKTKGLMDDNASSDYWGFISGVINLDGTSGPIAGSSANMGNLAGYNFGWEVFTRKGICFLISGTFFNSTERQKYITYLGQIKINSQIYDLGFGKDLTGPKGNFHIVPNVGGAYIPGIDNTFSLENGSNWTYSEDWSEKDFFALHAGVQMVYLFSKHFGLQAGGKYLFFPSTTQGTTFQTGNFFYFNLNLVFRWI